MKPIYSQTGGGFANDSPFTTINNPSSQPPGATWPFVKLTIYSDHVELKITKTTYSVTLSDIDSVHRVVSIPFIAGGVSIVHHGAAPRILIFWGRSNPILKQFANLGIKIGETLHGNPTVQSTKNQRIKLVIFILIFVVLAAYNVISKH